VTLSKSTFPKISEYYKNILTVAGGVLFSQLLTILISPFLTRVFSVESFGLIALFLAVTNILTVVSTLRLENAVFLPNSVDKAKSIFNITFSIGLIFFLITSTAISIYSEFYVVRLFEGENNFWISWLPTIVLLNGLFFLFRNWLQREKKYQKTTVGAIYKSISLNSFLVIGAFFSNSPKIFLFGNIFAQFVETTFLFFEIRRLNRCQFEVPKKTEITKTLREYRVFPTINLPSELLNVYTNQNPIILLAYFFNSSVVGWFSLTQRVIGIPVKLISSSTLEVYRQKASEEFNQIGTCDRTFKETAQFLFATALVPTAIVAIFSPILFEFVFGKDWLSAGYYGRYLSILFLFRFVSSPLGFTLIITGKHKWNLYWQASLLIVTSVGITIGFFFKSADLSVLLFSIGYSIMYLVYFLLSYKASLGKK
jgi:O-antigen/teichoic acid export membrane protein